MFDVKLIVSVNGKEEKIKLVHNPSSRNTERERFCLPDFAGKIVSTFLNGKHLYINKDLLKDPVKEERQTSRKTVSKEVPEVTQKRVTKSDLNKIKKSDLIDFILSQTE